MPEGDTVHLSAARLHDALAGEQILSADIRVPRFAVADLAGRTVREVRARGKHILMRLSGDLTLHSHLKMEGSWHLYRRGERWRGPDHQVRAVLTAPRSVAVGFRLGLLQLIVTPEEQTVLGHLGPDPLAEDWDVEEAVRRLTAQARRPIAEVLLDQSVVAGWGNVYKCELLFLRGVDPWTPVEMVRDPRSLIELGARLMHANRSTGQQITTGDPRPTERRWVYDRRGEPCRRCGTPVSYDAEGERVTYWCPSCQPPATPPGT